jgi:hypothetical protein
MSTMTCVCGHIISDVVCPCPTEGLVIGDQDYDHFDRDFTSQVASFLEAVREGRREKWLTEHFSSIYPRNLPDAEVISDILSWTQFSYVLSIAECESCGRLHVQVAPGINEYLTFAPDVPGHHRILVRKSAGG